ncbi:hypothetical protein AB6A40_011535 [Gnathostoma spinigerum]|uniref:Secreted protein n=1 Tax=Gnathostoma spinigerum TaxID=75299 RepID=A0ABD6EZG2_9BILA
MNVTILLLTDIFRVAISKITASTCCMRFMRLHEVNHLRGRELRVRSIGVIVLKCYSTLPEKRTIDSWTSGPLVMVLFLALPSKPHEPLNYGDQPPRANCPTWLTHSRKLEMCTLV